ncbi:hypothetical protein D3C71_156390 [compost metagenome]
MNATLGDGAEMMKHGVTQAAAGFLRFQLGWDTPRKLSGIPGFDGTQDQIINIQVSNILPRRSHGLKWADFPVLQNPEFPSENEFLGYRRRMPRKWEQIRMTVADLRGLMREQAAFVYDEASPETDFPHKYVVEKRFFVARLHEQVGQGKPFWIRFRGTVDFIEMDPSILSDQSAGWHRYHHNYTLNFEAIGCKAIDHVIARYSSLPKPKPIIDGMPYRDRMNAEELPNRQAGYFKYRNTFLTDPVGLQTLFALRNASDAERAGLFQFFASWPHRDPDGPQMTFGGHVRSGVWSGSGKYAGINLQEQIGWALTDGMPLGLVDLETDERVGLTDAGNALLDIMHTDNYDPDAFLRFTDADTMTIASSQVSRIDSWMGRFFGKMKTKVDRLA